MTFPKQAQKHSPTLYIMQGIPGSGKSTLANMILRQTMVLHKTKRVAICSTDSFHINPETNVFEYKPELAAIYHAQNIVQALAFMEKGYTVIVDNTNIQRWEAKPYVACAIKLGIPIVFIRVKGNFPNIHGVPEDVIQRMKLRMEDLSVELCLQAVSPNEK